jgi:glutathionylspermidine synthase
MNELDEYFCEELDLLKRISVHNAHIGENPPRACNGYQDNAVDRQEASLMNPNWRYVPSNQTDVRKTWERFGFVPKTP